MRLVPRALAITTTAALAVAGLSVPAYAATALTCLTSPINNTNRTMVAFSGTDTPLRIQAVTATSTGPNSASPAGPVITGMNGTFSGTLDVTALPDGLVTITAESNGGAPLGSTATCTANKETVPPPAATDITFLPLAPINASEQAAVAITAVAADADVARVQLTVLDGTTELATTNPTRASDGTWTSTFDLRGFPEGTLTVRARTFDAVGNANAYTETFVKNTVAPSAPTVVLETTAMTPTPVTRVNAASPGGAFRIRGQSTTTAGDDVDHVVTVTDSLGAVSTPVVSQTGDGTTTAGYSAVVDPYTLADGTLTIRVTATDSFGNSSATTTTTLVKDTSVPAVVDLTVTPNPIGEAGDDSVVVTGRVVLKSGLTDPSEPGTTIRVRIPGGPAIVDDPMTLEDETAPTSELSQTATIAGDGSFSFTFNLDDYPDQTLMVKALATDPRGNASPEVTVTDVKDTMAPTKPGTPITANATPSNVTAVSIAGTADAGTTVEVRVTDSAGVVRTLPIFTTNGGSSAPNSGTWSGTFDATDLAEGTFTVTARATDAAGNVSLLSDAGSGQKDTVELAEVAKSPTGRAAPNTTVRVNFNEPLSPSSTLNVVTLPGNAPVAGATSFADGGQTIVFTRTGGTFADGSYRATYNVTESRPGADQLGPVSFDFLIDATAPPAPIINAFPVVNIASAGAAPISGTGEPLATITITVTDSTTSGPPLNTPQPVTRTKSVVVALDGTWSTTIDTTGQAEGALTATATQTDTSGNTSGASAARSTTKDVTRPTATVTAASDVTQASSSTTVSGGGSDNGATFTTTISLGGVSRTGTGTTGANGAYSTTIDATALPDGVVSVSTVVRDAAGNDSVAATRTFRKDTEGPFISGLAATNATVASGGTTTVSGQTNDGTTTVTIVVSDGTTTVTATPTPAAMAPGAFSTDIDVSSLREGPLTVSAVAKDSFGNSGEAAPASATKDTIAPVVTGLAATATNVADSTSTVSGSTEPASTVAITVTVGGTTKTASATAGVTGAFTVDVDLAGAPDGPVAVKATATDVIGNVGPEATASTTRDATKPVIADLRSTDTNASQTTSTVTGTTEPGASVALSATSPGSTTPVTGTATADMAGAFSATLQFSGLADGTVTVTATATDAADNLGDAVTATSTKDTGSPTLTALNGTDVNAANTVTTLTGTVSEAGADLVITVTSGATTLTKTLTDLVGTTFSTTLDLATLADGAALAVSATATDAGGNTGAALTDTLRKDTVAPTVATVTATGTSSATPGSTVSGTGEPGSTIAVSITSPGSTSPVTATTTVANDGTFSVVVDTSPLADGELTVTATATDPAGNTGTAKTVDPKPVKDVTGPTVATLTATATNGANTVTTIAGTTAAGSVVTLTAASSGGPGSATTTVTAASDGTFTKTLDLVGVPDGTITVTAVAKDSLQNPGPAKTATAGKDTVAPALTGLGATGTTTATPRTTVTGTTDNGQSVTVTVTSGSSTATGTATGSATDGTFSVQVDLASFPEGEFTVTVSATDAAGNPATATTKASKDTSGPLVTELAATGTNASSAVSTVTGKTETGSSVVVTATDGTKTVTKTVTAAAGAFSTTLDLTGFADGTVTTTARATDAGGNTGAVSSVTSTRDTAAPAVTELAATRTSASQQVSTVTGKAETGSSVVVTATDGTKTVTKTVTASAGAFSTTLDLTGFADGTVTTTARATDSAGNQGATATVTSTRDTVAPTVTGLAATASTNATPGSTVTGTTEGGSSVALTATDSAGKTVTGTATAATGGGFSAVLDLSGLAQGTVTVTAVATDTAGNTGPAATATTSRSANALRFVALTSPVRAMDSRNGTGTSTGLKRGAVELDLTSRVPASATGAVLNVTVTQPETGGFVVVYPAGTTQPPTSNVNFAAGQTQANEVVTALSSRKATVFVSGSGRAHLVVDVVGYFTAEAGAGGFLTTLAPQRVLGSALARNIGSSSGSSSVDVDLSDALPAGATGAILNVTIASPSQPGFVVAYPTGTADPGTSNVNFAANQVQANEVITRVSADGKVRLTLSRGQARLIVDVVGAIVPSTVAGAKRFTPLPTPVRALDTRSGLGTTGTSRRTSSTPVVLSLPSSVPSDAVGVVLNVTSTGQVGSGFVVAFPTGTAQPGTSNVNFRAGVNQANEVVVGLGTGSNAGKVTLAVGGGTGSPATHLIADVVGYLR